MKFFLQTLKVAFFSSLIIILFKECNNHINSKSECKEYLYKIDLCDNCFGAWDYTNCIDWENGMLIYIKEDSVKKTVRPLAIEEGIFIHCEVIVQNNKP